MPSGVVHVICVVGKWFDFGFFLSLFTRISTNNHLRNKQSQSNFIVKIKGKITMELLQCDLLYLKNDLLLDDLFSVGFFFVLMSTHNLSYSYKARLKGFRTIIVGKKVRPRRILIPPKILREYSHTFNLDSLNDLLWNIHNILLWLSKNHFTSIMTKCIIKHWLNHFAALFDMFVVVVVRLTC